MTKRGSSANRDVELALEDGGLKPVSRLRLDPRNPRLATVLEDGDRPSQEELVRRLWKSEAADELAISIAENGYYQQEPLLVVPSEDDPAELVVVEGNRRFAAVLVLLNEQLRREVGATDVPVPSEERREQLQNLPVLVYRDREQIWAYLGFRHINGTKPWDAYSKARYVASVHDAYGVPLDMIARRIGDRHSTVERLYRGLKVLQQAEEAEKFSRSDAARGKFFFSHLYTAIDQGEFQRFLGMDPKAPTKPNPVPKSKLVELELLMTWLYGRKSTNTPALIHTQNPDLNRLRDAIANPRALSLLRAGRPLDEAYLVSLGASRRFREALATAHEAITSARGTVVNGFLGEADLLETVDEIGNVVTSLRDEMLSMARKTGLAKDHE